MQLYNTSKVVHRTGEKIKNSQPEDTGGTITELIPTLKKINNLRLV